MASIAPEVRNAIRRAVEHAEQPEGVANKLISWIDRVASGGESLVDAESVQRHLDVLMDALDVEPVKEEQ